MIKSFISLIFTELKFLCLKLIYRKRFIYSGIQRFSPNTEISIGKNASVILGKMVRAHTGVRLRARKNSIIEIGSDVAFGYNCLITAYEKIVIGDGTEIGPGVLFYDHDHDFREHNLKEHYYKTSPIIIGKNVWIGANVIILRGSIIGDNSVIAAGTVIKGIYPKNVVIRNAKETVYNNIN